MTQKVSINENMVHVIDGLRFGLRENALKLEDCQNRLFLNCDFIGCNLSEINMEGGSFEGCLFNGCTFDEANLSGTVFERCDIKESIFQNCNLTSATFDKSTLFSCLFKFCEMTNISIFNCKMVRVDWSLSCLCDSQLYGTTLQLCNSTRTNWEKCTISSCTLENNSYTSDFFSNAKFYRSVIEACVFTNVELLYLIQASTKVNRSYFIACNLSNSHISRSTLMDVVYSKCNMELVEFANLSMRRVTFEKVDLCTVRLIFVTLRDITLYESDITLNCFKSVKIVELCGSLGKLKNVYLGGEHNILFCKETRQVYLNGEVRSLDTFKETELFKQSEYAHNLLEF